MRSFIKPLINKKKASSLFVTKEFVTKTLVAPCLALLVLGLASCTSTETQNKESQQAINSAITSPDAWATQVQKNAGKYQNTTAKWLESFNDPLLLTLIAEGKKNNLNLKIAAGNMDSARLLAKQSGAALKPTVNLSAGRGQSGSVNGGGSNSSANVGLNASWEADVWGRIQAGVNAAQASAQSAEADYLYAQYSLGANVAIAYFKVIAAKQQMDITNKNLTILKETMRITQVKYDNGTSSAQDVAVNRANLASAEGQLIAQEGAERNALRSLEVLLGRYPNALIEIPDVLPNLPSPPPVGVPSTILERRPDIVSAERQIAKAFSATAEAKAATLPSFSLTANVGGTSTSLSDVLSPSNVVWQLAANLLAPLYDGGKLELDVEIADVAQKQAIANYADKALKAFSEVELNLDQSTVLARQEVALSEVSKQSAKAYRIAKLRYKEGEIDLLDTLIIQQQAISAESNLLAIKETQLEQRINLYMALGGSW